MAAWRLVREKHLPSFGAENKAFVYLGQDYWTCTSNIHESFWLEHKMSLCLRRLLGKIRYLHRTLCPGA